MNVGVVGRHAAILERVLALVSSHGHSAKGTLVDADALSWINSRDVQYLLIGGGVEDASRKSLLAACAAHQVQAIEVFGLHNLELAIAGLQSDSSRA